MTAVLCGNLRAEIVSSAGIRRQRISLGKPRLISSCLVSPPGIRTRESPITSVYSPRTSSRRAGFYSGWDSICAIVVPSGVPQPLTAS
jgi:hypothetical protein